MRYAYAINHNHAVRHGCRRVRTPGRPTMLRLVLNIQHRSWAMRLAGEPLARLMKRMTAGEWKMPPGWLVRMADEFVLPARLVLRAKIVGATLLLTADPPLEGKTTGADPGAKLFNGTLSEAQCELARLMLAGMTIHAAARRMGYSPRWAQYQLRKIRRCP